MPSTPQTLVAPTAGEAVPLASVPDPVFSTGALGELSLIHISEPTRPY